MKIGILTFHNIPNIGAMLQAQALCQYIRGLGMSCEIVDYTCDNIVNRELTFHPSKNIVSNVLLRLAWHKTEKKILECRKYMKKLGIVSQSSYNHFNIKTSNQVYDAFISGSDMIWNFQVTGGDKAYFADFANPDKACISYGSSIGEIWTDEEKQIAYSLLRKYKAISVRESDTNQLLVELGLESTHVADPTLLLEPRFWMNLALKPHFENYVLVYFPSNEILVKAKEYARVHSKKVVVISTGLFSFGIKKVFPLNPSEWLGLFLYSDAVFTNSYHGVLYSLYFQKNVWTGNYGNRITSLLETLGISGCRVDLDTNLHYSIDYKNVNNRLSLLRKDSQQFLDNAIQLLNNKF